LLQNCFRQQGNLLNTEIRFENLGLKTIIPFHALILLLLKIVICKILHEFHSGFCVKQDVLILKSVVKFYPTLAEILFVVTLD